MGAFSLFRRLRASEPAKTTSEPSAVASTGKSTASNSKSSDSVELRKVTTKPKKPASKAAASTSNPAPSASSDATVAIPAVAPRVDLSILRSPSPPLVEVSVDGYRANSPWVDLAAEVEAPRRGSFGFGFIRSPSSSPTTRAVNEKLVEYLDGKLITPEQATVLVQACAKVLQGQGVFAHVIDILQTCKRLIGE